MSTAKEAQLKSRQAATLRASAVDGAGAPHFAPTREQHRQHFERLAARHVVETKGPDRLLRRIKVIERSLEEFQRRLAKAAQRREFVGATAMSLLENLSVVEEHVDVARQELSQRRRLPLPQIVAGPSAGLPRVFDLAKELVEYCDAEIEEESIEAAVAAYQSQNALTLRELWSMPPMLRLGILERLGNTAASLASDPSTSAEILIEDSISALRALGSVSWREFVERQSAVEAALRRDPLAIYPQMHPKSRECYRKAVEGLAARCPLDETHVALAAVELAAVAHGGQDPVARATPASQRHGAFGEGMKERHVGFFLVDRGRQMLEDRIGYRPSSWQRVTHAAAAAPLPCYLGAIGAVWLVLIALAVCVGFWVGIVSSIGVAWSALLAILWTGAASECAVRLVNCLATMLVEPRPTMRLDFSADIPDDCRTLVAVPTMLTGAKSVRDLVDKLEVRYLANRKDNLGFALVTDLADAATETLPEDAALLELARAEIEKLNAKYGVDDSEPFYLLHRPRKWNAQEKCWMGEERKRGKLGSLNRLLRGDSSDFSVTIGALDFLTSVRYVITLDSDTLLPRDTARELIEAMAHPLNRPRIDRAARTVVEGHAILQPRVTITIPEARQSMFAQLFAGDAGVDPYTQQTSDVYQDVFGEGSFIGKGIYDVDAIRTVFRRRFPKNRVLSHDLIEGCFARSGLINDVELFEGFPAKLPADMSRRHRWIRGDWQIAGWLGRKVPTASRTADNRLSSLSRWKIFDNLRRSVAPVFLLAFVLVAWIAAPRWAAPCLLIALAAMLTPDLLAFLPSVFRKPAGNPWSLHLKGRTTELGKLLCREAFAWMTLPYTVSCNLDAVVRALYRLHISERKLLEWTVSSEAERTCVNDRRGYYRLLWACPLIGTAAGTWLAMACPQALLWTAPLLLAWFAAPLIAWRVSQPRVVDAVSLAAHERANVRRWSRRTWHFFDTYVNEENNWLPPDNVQWNVGWTSKSVANNADGRGDPSYENVAPRTSPTNIGLAMLSDLAACDLGYLSATRLLDRTKRTLQTMLKLETHRGHLYNWYDTKTLEPLGQQYVSTVDSGNLRGALLVMQAGLAELRDRPLVGPRFADGFHDTLDVLSDMGIQIAGDVRAMKARNAGEALKLIERVEMAVVELSGRQDGNAWIAALGRQCAASRDALEVLAFWLGDNARERLKAELGSLPLGELLRGSLEQLECDCTLRELPEVAEQFAKLAAFIATKGDFAVELPALIARAQRAAEAAREQLATIDALIELCADFTVMDFRFLYNKQRKLLAIGYNITERRRDASCYDLLASECRLASFLAVSDGQLPADHWTALGRSVALHGGVPALMSWSGSMFEYLMPMLVMPSHASTLLHTSCRAAVGRHVKYAKEQGLPWGVSESCFDVRNDDDDYSYRAFGVPGLRLERRTDRTQVVAPYASALAAMVAPKAACENLLHLEDLGGLCEYGFYDAIDYSALDNKAAAGAFQPAACRTVMAHHSGMALVAFANILLDSPMRRRLMADPRLRAHDLLLQQRTPQSVRLVDWRKRERAARLLARLEEAAGQS
jgi:hypothetical protein